MSQIQIENRKLTLDGRPISMISAEIHYWRLEPTAWPRILEAAVDMGLETIASYVQWHFHEFEKGRYDFTGETDPKRDLVAYLDLVQKSGLKLFIRPGPYTFAEWDNYGIPDYVAGFHRLHPEFQTAAASYIRAVCKIILPYLATRGGPIVMLQTDNMFDLGQHRYDRQLGLLGGEGLFQDYLRDKYQSIEALSDAWQTEYRSFDQAMATTALDSSDAATQARFIDFLSFKNEFTMKAAAWTISLYREQGIDLPLYSNATRDQDPEQMAEVLDLVSFNHYPTRDYAMLPDEHRHLIDHVRLLSGISPIPYIAELEAGIWHGYHYTKGLPHPDHYHFMLLNVLAGGAVAWTWYMFHDRDNWYMSPVNSRGKKREEIFSVFRLWINLVQEIKPDDWLRCSSTGISFYQPHYAVQHPHEISSALYQAGLDFSFYSLSAPGEAPPILFYDGPTWLGETAQRSLIEYMENGGHLVIFQHSPRTDEKGAPMNLLDLPRPDGVDSQGYMNTFFKDYLVHLGDFKARVELPEAVYLYREVEGSEILAARTSPRSLLNDNVLEEYAALVELGREENLVVGFHKPSGAGSLTFLGVPPSTELVREIHHFLQIPIPASPRTDGVQTVLYRSGSDHYLIVLNNGWEDKATEILLDPSEFLPGRYGVRNLLRKDERVLEVKANQAIILSAFTPKKNGALLEIKPLG